MTPFEYISVLFSIILGLGITQLVGGVADIIQQWERVKIYWPHTLWIGFIFFLHLQAWWQFYDLQKYEEWHLNDFLIAMIYPIVLFVLARLLFPNNQSAIPLDFRDFYFQNFRKVFVWSIALIAISVLDNVLISKIAFKDQGLQFGLLIILSIVTYRNYRQEWVHKALVVLLLLIILAAMVSRDWAIRQS